MFSSGWSNFRRVGRSCRASVSPKPVRAPRHFLSLCAFALLACSGCRTIPDLPPEDISEAGWSARQGQAVWRASAEAPELAGELLVATHPERGLVLQFIKTPFPIVSAQATPGGWKIVFPDAREFAGRGNPPSRISWFQLRAALQGSEVSRPWIFQTTGERNWRLENRKTGEYIEGYLHL